ncbi:MAG: DEAD/DEAH box helicase [Saprospiraceae bacterium]|nr:DEAD/DEAH box helicase [Saprospiraceae bacterium]
MFLNNAIHQYIKEAGLNPLAKLGSELVRQGLTSHPLHLSKRKVILLVIDENYHLAIHYKNAFKLEHVACSCGQKNPCEHIFGGLFYLLESEDADLVETIEIPPVFGSVINTNEEGVYDLLPTFALNDYRNLEIVDSVSYAEFLNVYKPPFLRNFTSFTLEKIVLRDENHLSGYLSEKNYFQDEVSGKWHNVDIKKSDFGFSIKCNTCSEKSFSVCIHQYEVLKSQDIKSILLFGNMPDYQEELLLWSKKLDIQISKFKHLYELVLDGQVTNVLLVNHNFYTQNRLSKLRQNIESELFAPNDSSLLEDQDETDGSFGNAILWSSDHNGDVANLIKGKMDKLGSEFHSKIESVLSPEYLPSHEKTLWYQLERFIRESSKENKILKDKSWNRFLQNKVDTINQLTHYVITSKVDFLLISKRNIKRINFSSHFVDLVVSVEQNESFYTTRLKLKINDKEIEPKEHNILLMPYFLVIQNDAYIFKHPEIGRLISMLGWDEIIVDTDHSAQFTSFLFSLYNIVEVQFPNEIKPDTVTLENPHWKIKIREKGNYLVFTPMLEYGEQLEVKLPVDKWLFTKKNDQNIYTIPEEDIDKFTRFFLEQHEQFEYNLFNHGSFFLHYKDYLYENWFLQFFEKCRDYGISIFGLEELENYKMNTYKPSIKMGLSSGIDWFNVDVDISYGDQAVPAKVWLEAMKSNEKYILLGDGSLGLIPDEWFHSLKRLSLVAYEEKGVIKLNKFHFNIVESLFDDVNDDELHKAIKRKITILSEYDFEKKHELPPQNKAELRDYQKLGFQWLKSLSELGFGGCLADDMGLGKTLQVLTLLSDQKILGKISSLIVVPRSLLFNWANEINKFCPELSYIHYHGTERKLLRPSLLHYDIVITTYDTCTNDIEFLKDLKFNYIILDESQAIKNPESKRYKAMRLLQSHNKIVITGTPIENNTFDLYAQFSFVNPGIFGSVSQFKTNFAIPIDKESDGDSAFMLKKLIHPFLLRRTKAQVASDLPERSESLLYCEMGDTQRAMYEEFRSKIKFEIEEGVKQVGINKMRIRVIEGLLRLRQICNSPQLIDQNLPNHLRQSVKIETLLDIIENDLGDHHALVYSQFTSMLALVRHELDKRNIPYAYLDGSTKDRQGAVSDFMDKKEVRLFLISLKAGSTGLNLVKADYVYILDPWWNPAVEAQAIDRTHRIGQEKNVFAYKMICRDTIEEKIVLLQEKKKQLATDLIITDEHVFKSLNNDDLMSLFN